MKNIFKIFIFIIALLYFGFAFSSTETKAQSAEIGIPCVPSRGVVCPGTNNYIKEEKSFSLSKEAVQLIVDKVLDLNKKNIPKEQIVNTIFDMYGEKNLEKDKYEEEGDDSQSSKFNSEFKKLNFGQAKKKFTRGDSGEEIKLLQEALNKIATDLSLEFDVLVVDGKYGSGTMKVIKMIQAVEGLKEDGVVGPVTLAKLQDLLEKGVSGSKNMIKSNLSSLRSIFEIIYDMNGHYGIPETNTNACSVSKGLVSGLGAFKKDDILKYIQTAVTASGGKNPLCLSSDNIDGNENDTTSTVTSWSVSIPIDSARSWCVDSNGFNSYGIATFSSIDNKVSCVN